MDVEKDVCMACQSGLSVAADADDRRAEAFQMREEVEEFGRFTAVAEQDRQIAGIDDTEVAVHGLGGVQEEGRGAGAGQRRGAGGV